jgi:hypothetical protein
VRAYADGVPEYRKLAEGIEAHGRKLTASRDALGRALDAVVLTAK